MGLIWNIFWLLVILMAYDYYRTINPAFSATVQIKAAYAKIKAYFAKDKPTIEDSDQ